MKIGQIRHGDVLLVPVDATPPEIAEKRNEVVLAEGELTGHAHRLASESGVLVWDDMVWVVGEDPGYLSHEEHDPVPAPVVAPEQAYKIVIQREYDLSGQWRQVVD